MVLEELIPGTRKATFMKSILALCLVGVLLWAAGSMEPALAMRCGSRLISEGDPRDKLANECGPPSNVETWEEERYHHYDVLPPSNQYREFERYGSAYRVKVYVRVELWTYNYGPSRFMDYVRIENGRVVRIYSGGYGY
jgi:hypothetical protein